MTYGPQPGWNPNQPPGPPRPGYPAPPPPGYPAQQPMAPPGPMPMGPPPGQYPMGPGQPRSQPPANPTMATVAGVLTLLVLVLTIVLRVTPLGLHRSGLHFSFHGRFILDLPGHIIVAVLLAAGGVMLLLKKFPGQIIAIVGAVLDIALTLFFVFGFLRIGIWVIDIATIVVCALPGTARALGRRATPPPFMPMGPPGQFGPPPGQPQGLPPGQPMPGQPMPGQPMPGQQFPPQQFPPQPGFPPQQPPPGYPPQQFPPPPPPGQQPPAQ